jgi:hypothetical protein
MPLPDANKKSPRVYTNLQNLDLDNVTFANVQATGNPINVEEANEDELRRLVLVNLARLVTAGEWTGLLESSSGGGLNQLGILGGSSYDTYDISVAAPYGIALRDTDSVDDEPCFQPFLSPNTGTIDAVTIGVSSAAASTCNLKIGFYNADEDTGLPTTIIASCDIDLTSTGDIRQTSFTGTPSLTKNTLYYAAYCRSTSVAATVRSAKSSYAPGAGPTNSTEDTKTHLELQSSNNTLPSTVTASDLETTNSECPSILLEW